MSLPNPEFDPVFEKQKQWKSEMLKLREILLGCGLEEVKKWWQPCYTYNGTNLVIIGSFKDFCTLSFFKGVLLKDEENILEFAGPNTRSAKVVKFTSLEQIIALEKVLKNYINEALALEKEGKKITLEPSAEHQYPTELEDAFKEDPDFEQAFISLTPGRRRSWLLHFNSAKQSATKVSRIKKALPKIFEGKGMNE